MLCPPPPPHYRMWEAWEVPSVTVFASPGTGMGLPGWWRCHHQSCLLVLFFSSQDSASPVGTPRHSVGKTTSTEDPKGTHSEGLVMMPPVGVSPGSLKSEFVLSTSAKQQGQPATSSVGQVSSSPGKRGGNSYMTKVGRFTGQSQEPQGALVLHTQMWQSDSPSLVIVWFRYCFGGLNKARV